MIVSEFPEKILAHYRGENSSVVSLILRGGTSSFEGTGTFGPNSEHPPEDMIFEIGSITKVFTSILLAVLIEEGKIDLDCPIKEISPSLNDVPSSITFKSLATHTSGLPRIHVPIWKAVMSSMPEDPYAAFTKDDLIKWLRDWKGKATPKRPRHSYSNLGFGLLGEALAISEGKPYLELLHEKVINPFGLVDTTSDLTTSQQARFMQPFSVQGKPVVPWTFQAIAGAGCLRSTARDLGRFMAMVLKALADPETSLDRAICRSVEPLLGLGPFGKTEPVAQCLGWLSIKQDPKAPRMLFHNGGTAGSTSALYLCPEANSGALILSNRGVAAHLWSSIKLGWSNPDRAMRELLAR